MIKINIGLSIRSFSHYYFFGSTEDSLETMAKLYSSHSHVQCMQVLHLLVKGEAIT